MAYEISDGVYLNGAQVPGYGRLARQPLESLQAGARVEAVEEKRSKTPRPRREKSPRRANSSPDS